MERIGTMRRMLFCVSVPLISVAVLFVALEGSLRLISQLKKLPLTEFPTRWRDNHYKILSFDPELGWKFKPNFYKNNRRVTTSEGFYSSRNFDFSSPKKRILLLGDSMLFGAGMPQSEIFSEILNRENEHIDFINTGVLGYSTGQEYLVQKRFSQLIRPTTTILFYTQENDMPWNVRRDFFNPGFSLKNGKLIHHQASPHNPLPWYKATTLYRFLDANFLFGKDTQTLFQKISFAVQKENAYIWRVARQILARMKTVSEENHYNIIVVDIPTYRQINHPNTPKTRQTLLKKTAEELRFAYYDLLDIYPKDPLKLLLPHNTHWNENGHRFIANLVMTLLEQAETNRAIP